MISLVLLVISQKPVDVLDSVIPVRTGSNGYEEFVRGAQMLRDLGVGEFRDLFVRSGKGAADWDVRPAKKRPAWMRVGGSRLEFYRAAVARFAPAMEMMRRGTLEPARYPLSSVGATTLYPEYAYFRGYGDLLCARAAVAWADGDSVRAQLACEDLVRFVKHVPLATSVTLNVVRAIQGRMAESLNDHGDSISLEACLRLAELFEAKVGPDSKPNQGIALLRSEYVGGLAEFIQNPRAIQSEDQEAGTKRLVTLPIEVRSRMFAEAARRFTSSLDSAERRLNGPEREWANALPEQDVD